MKSKKKVLVTLLCAVLLVFASVMGTLAWLTDNSEQAVNTFTVGKVEISLNETDVDLYGKKDGDTPVIQNTYKLIPGNEYIKDPTVHVMVGSEPSWVFVEVVDEIAEIQDATTVKAQILAKGWTELDGVAGVYYKANVDARAAQVDLPVFENFTIKSDANVAAYDGKTIKIKAYAVQAEASDNAAGAWAARATE